MASGKRPDGNIFASGAGEGELLDFPSLQRGWGITMDGEDSDGKKITEPTNGIPPMEWFNTLHKRTDEAILWMLQNAWPDWAKGKWPMGATVVNAGTVWRAKKETEAEPSISAGDWQALFPLVDLDKRYLHTDRALDLCPVGSPILWVSDIAPEGYAIMQGQLFDNKKYPILAKLFPSSFLPDWREQTPKGKPPNREVMSFEEDGVKSHAHTGTVSPTDLGRKTTNPFDYGSKPTTAFDYGNKGTDVQGWHDHAGGMRGPGTQWGDMVTGTDNSGHYPLNRTDANGNHAHTVYIGAHDHWVGIGPHDHFIDMGAHEHAVIINAFGNKENTVKNIAVNFIVRLA